MAFEHQAEARRKQNVAVLGAFAAIDKNLADIEVDIADLDLDELAHAHRRIEEQLEQDLVLHVTAVLDGAEEAFQIGVGKQLRQPALFASPAQAQLLAGLLRDIEKIVVPQPGLARDTHELSHDGGFRLFIWRYEVDPLCGPFGFHSCIHGCILLRLLAHILDGENPHIKFKKVGFTVSTPALEESDAEALQHYFPERDFVPLMEVLATVNRHTGWMEEFQHWQQRHHHGQPADRVVYAGVIGIGCTIGIRKMARISHPISESELENAVNWFFSVDNINAASDRVLQLMDRLELPKLLQRTPGRSHTSSDGQKFEVRVDFLNANHSFKYFGKEQGVSVYTFRDERDLLWHSLVFSAADRESAYVIDGLLHNEVVKSDIHSTDAFGYTEAIFATSHLTGFSYAPRFKNLKRQRLYIFRSRQSVDRSAWKIKPAAYCDEQHIIQFWDDILRFIATIKLKETTPSDIFRRLNSYSK